MIVNTSMPAKNMAIADQDCMECVPISFYLILQGIFADEANNGFETIKGHLGCHLF
jgi:hypothetical protein